VLRVGISIGTSFSADGPDSGRAGPAQVLAEAAAAARAGLDVLTPRGPPRHRAGRVPPERVDDRAADRRVDRATPRVLVPRPVVEPGPARRAGRDPGGDEPGPLHRPDRPRWRGAPVRRDGCRRLPRGVLPPRPGAAAGADPQGRVGGQGSGGGGTGRRRVGRRRLPGLRAGCGRLRRSEIVL